MTRRTLLELLCATGLRAEQAASGYIDSHVHFYDPTRPQGVPWPGSKTDKLYRPTLPVHWRNIVRPLGITGVVVVEASPWLEDNQWVLDLAKDNPEIVGFVGHLEPGAPEFSVNLKRFAANPVFRGIRLSEKMLHNAFRETALDDLRRLADHDLALDVLGNGPMLTDVAKLAKLLPNQRIVVDHLPFDSAPVELATLQGHPNVYAKVSGAIGKLTDYSAMERVWETFGPDRVIFASNWPVCERLAPYEEVWKAVHQFFDAKGLSAAVQYFRTNSEAAYRWVWRS